jgi:hypothetical protein
MFSRFEIAPLLEISEERGLRTIQAPRHDTHTDSILEVSTFVRFQALVVRIGIQQG